MTFDCYQIERELRIARTMLDHASTLEQREEALSSLQYWQKRAELMYADDGLDADDADMLTWQAAAKSEEMIAEWDRAGLREEI